MVIEGVIDRVNRPRRTKIGDFFSVLSGFHGNLVRKPRKTS